MGLPIIAGAQPIKIDNFYKKLVYNIQSVGHAREVEGHHRKCEERTQHTERHKSRPRAGTQRLEGLALSLVGESPQTMERHQPS